MSASIRGVGQNDRSAAIFEANIALDGQGICLLIIGDLFGNQAAFALAGFDTSRCDQ